MRRFDLFGNPRTDVTFAPTCGAPAFPAKTNFHGFREAAIFDLLVKGRLCEPAPVHDFMDTD